MNRFVAVDSLVLGIAVFALAVPGLALADVLEIRESGPVWLTAPLVAPNPEEQPAAEEATLAPPTSVPFTEVDVSAGPAQWRARVAELSAKYDISPSLLEAVVWQESRWRPNAVSPVGALGLAQLMPGTAKDLGVNPFDPHANLEGGARYLRQLLDKFNGDLIKALAAYNAGPNRVERVGGVPNIRETKDYVASIMGRMSSSIRR